MAGSRKNDAPGNIRSDMFILRNRGNVLSDEEESSYESPPTSVCIIVMRNGKILSVSRGINLNDLNLPGGGIKLGESAEEAARRELKEETGLAAGKMVRIHHGTTANENVCVAFKVLTYSGSIKSSREGFARWVEPQELLNGTYGQYFQVLSSKLGII